MSYLGLGTQVIWLGVGGCILHLCVSVGFLWSSSSSSKACTNIRCVCAKWPVSFREIPGDNRKIELETPTQCRCYYSIVKIKMVSGRKWTQASSKFEAVSAGQLCLWFSLSHITGTTFAWWLNRETMKFTPLIPPTSHRVSGFQPTTMVSGELHSKSWVGRTTPNLPVADLIFRC